MATTTPPAPADDDAGECVAVDALAPLPAFSSAEAAATRDSPAAAPAARATAARPPPVMRMQELVEAPALQQVTFDSWELFHAHLTAYGQMTSQLYSVRSATPAASRNAKVRKRKFAEKQLLVPEHFVHYVKTVACTHAGKPRPRSTGARPNHQHRAIECPARMSVCVKKDPQGVWRVHVTHQHVWHNHEVSAAIYNGYPEVRNAFSAEVLATVNILRRADAKSAKILEYLVENTPLKPRMKDVHNLLSRMSRRDER